MEQSLKELLSSGQSENGNDVVVFFSGGKDSTFALSKIAENIADPSRILAVTRDNGFISNGTKKNIEIVTKKLGVRHEYFQVNKKALFSLYKKLFLAGKKNPRAVCVGCNILTERLGNTILEKYQPAFFATGNRSEEFSLFQKWLKKNKIEEKGTGNEEFEFRHGMWAYNQKILKSVCKENSAIYKQISAKEPTVEGLVSKRIKVFDFVEYSLPAIMKKIESLGWIHPIDVVGLESDCNFTQAIVYSFLEENGQAAYEKTVLGLVKEKKIPIELAVKAIDTLPNTNPKMARKLLKKIGNSQKAAEQKIVCNAIADLLPLK